MNLQAQNRFLLEQRITPLVNRYDCYLYDGTTRGVQVAFVEQKRFKLREEITAWTSPSQGQVLFSLRAEKRLDIHGKFFVTDGDGQSIGYLRKAFGASLLRSTWEVFDARDTPVLVSKEKNQTVALLRRVGGFIPVVGDVFEWLPFNFVLEHDGKVVGHHQRVFKVKDTYDIHLEGRLPEVDRRLIIALGIALDALQDR